jgi:DNA modification methylase
MFRQILTAKIDIPKQVARKTYANIETFANSLAEHHLHPITVQANSDRYTLIAGSRRLKAFIHLGKPKIYAKILPSSLSHEQCVRLTIEENAARQDLSLSEQYESVEPLETILSRQNLPGGDNRGNGKTSDALGAILGYSGRKLEKIKAIVVAARENPERYGQFLEAMDKHGRVENQYQRMLDYKDEERREKYPVNDGNCQINQIVQGDSLVKMRAMAPNSVDVIFTDPPWGIGFKYNDKKEPACTAKAYWRWFEPYFREMYRIAKPGSLIAIFQAWKYRNHIPNWFKGHDPQEFIVCKNHANYSKQARKCNNFIIQTDVVVFIWKITSKEDRCLVPIDWKGINRCNWFAADMKTCRHGRWHECPKPLDALRHVIKTFTRESSLVFDPFCGSGGIPLAAKLEGRQYMGVEIDPYYCERANNTILTFKNLEDKFCKD